MKRSGIAALLLAITLPAAALADGHDQGRGHERSDRGRSDDSDSKRDKYRSSDEHRSTPDERRARVSDERERRVTERPSDRDGSWNRGRSREARSEGAWNRGPERPAPPEGVQRPERDRNWDRGSSDDRGGTRERTPGSATDRNGDSYGNRRGWGIVREAYRGNRGGRGSGNGDRTYDRDYDRSHDRSYDRNYDRNYDRSRGRARVVVRNGWPIHRTQRYVVIRSARRNDHVFPRLYLGARLWSNTWVRPAPRHAVVWQDHETLYGDDDWTEFSLGVGARGDRIGLSVEGAVQIDWAEVVYSNGETEVVDFDGQTLDPGEYELLDFGSWRTVDHVRMVARTDSPEATVSLLMDR